MKYSAPMFTWLILLIIQDSVQISSLPKDLLRAIQFNELPIHLHTTLFLMHHNLLFSCLLIIDLPLPQFTDIS